MAGSVNKVILIGNLGNDPEIRVSQDGKKMATLSLATSESWRDKNTNEKQERTEWHRIVIFSPGLADIAEKYCKKGSKLYIEGQLQTRKYNDQAGVEKSLFTNILYVAPPSDLSVISILNFVSVPVTQGTFPSFGPPVYPME